ncbi:MAG: glycogen synthase [Gemmatimonadales bacterium]
MPSRSRPTDRPADPASPLRTATGQAMGVVHLVAEYWPFARTGGLAEAVSSLASFQASSGLPTTVVMPLYRSVRGTARTLEPAGPAFTVQVGPRAESAQLYRLPAAATGPAVFFIEHPGYFDRAGLYGEAGSDYPDNARRFAFFCRAALQVLPRVAPGPQVVHAHDWHTALAPVYLRTLLPGDPYYRRLAVVLSVHNAGFQGHFPFETLADVGLPDQLYDWRRMEWYGRVNFLKGGLVFADAATTVSPTHAHELRTQAGGFGLHDIFIGLRDRLVGITNGIDFEAWNPATDPQIDARYSAQDPSPKRRCKAALQRAFGLPVLSRTPLFGMTARLVAQKGLDIILGGNMLLTFPAQFIFLGAGEERYEMALQDVVATGPDRVALELNFTDRLEHHLMAGADLFLMPSLYEPCGLTQMRAQRYGAIPVARRVGGLADTIEDGVTGFLFDEYTPDSLESAVRRAIDQYEDQPAWQLLVHEAMTRDFGWARSAAKYLELYRRVVEARPVAR